jgi:ribosomal protein S18 acetylase RimI-like enzyme
METIVDLERMAAAHWRGTEEEWLGDWLLRAAEGFTGRANSALPLGDPGLPLDDALAAVASWYRARGLPPMIVVPTPIEPASAGDALDEHLARRSWLTRPGPAFVMLADLPLDATADGPGQSRAVQIDPEPDDAWAARYHYRGQDYLPPIARKVLTSAEDQSFVSIRDGGEVLAIARLSVAGGWAGLTAVEVHPDHRRQRLGVAITSAACREAERYGASRVFLQVETDNDPAQALYRRLGFRYSHRYHYRVAPASRPAAGGPLAPRSPVCGDTPGTDVLGRSWGTGYVWEYGYLSVQGRVWLAGRADGHRRQ